MDVRSIEYNFQELQLQWLHRERFELRVQNFAELMDGMQTRLDYVFLKRLMI